MSSISPNLPKENVKTVVMSTINKEIVKRVEELNIKVIPSRDIGELLPFEQSHADLQLLHFDNNTVFVAKECEFLKQELQKHFNNIVTINKELKSDYPNNVLLNSVVLSDKIICNTNTICDEILNKAYFDNLDVIHTNQGYTKCSICVVNKNSIITADKSIYKACKNKIDVLLITPGYIDLPETDYGFIGGASFKYNKDTLIFTGNIKHHPNYDEIKSFALNHNVYIESLTNRKLLDIGSIIPIY